ncbi:MAG: TrkH family potassium uptake protein [Peptostreptococcaceae bacterium]|nr:TrkH family potassium uptake protein [Peptostreptococcaceae bacterium]MDY5738589.1 TrkH family potassium uptake protein [Anaerovoracaceae bacterium]
MTINFHGVIKVLGIMLMILAVAMLLPVIVGFYYKEIFEIKTFFKVIIPCLILGMVLFHLKNPSLTKLKARDGFLIVSLTWIISSLVSALPFVISGTIPNYFDAFFEMCSGYSTTGSTILTEIEGLPKSMLFWRSFTHWLGGMGIIVFAMIFLESGVKGQLIASAETPGPTLDKLTPRFSDTARNLYVLYFVFTIIEAVLLMLGGLSLYDALVQTFGTVGTGGFSNYNNSIAHFRSPYIHWVIIIFMTLCGINFNLYFIAFKQSIKAALEDIELRTYLSIIAIFSLAIAAYILIIGYEHSIFKAVTDATFQVVAVITTTGYMTYDFDIWPTFAKILIFLLMFVGASSSSTGGGVKVIRIVVAAKFIKKGINKILHPNRLYEISIGDREIQQETASNIANFIFMYIATIIVGTLLVSLNNFDILTSFSAVLTCIGNIGPGFNLVGPTMNFSIFSDFSKLVLSIIMIAGRLELFTLFMLFSPHYYNSNKA